MKRYILKRRTISFILIFIIIFLLIVNFSCVITAYNSNHVLKKPKLLKPGFPVVKKLIERFLQRAYDPNVSMALKSTNNRLDTIPGFKTNFKLLLPDNTTKTLDLLNNDTKIIKLYNNRFGIRSSDKTFTLLPKESTVLSNENVNESLKNLTLIDIPDSETVIGTENPIVEVPIDAMDANVIRQQDVQSLNEYEVTALFTELDNPDLFENILCYSIDWGDGSPIEHFLPDQKNTSHLYENSGTYEQVLYITDISDEVYSFTNMYTVEYEGHLLHTYFVFDEYKDAIAVTSVGIGTITFLGFALTEIGKYKFLSLLTLLIPMYTHIKKEDVLDNFVRGQIYGLIKANPGICYTKIMQKLDVKNGTLSYHLHKLEKMEIIKSRREGFRYQAFYPTDMKFPKEERFRLTDLQINILKTVKANNGITQREIAKMLSKNPQTINYNIKVLRQSELIKLIRQGRKTVCYSN